jgi:hypothetical protein
MEAIALKEGIKSSIGFSKPLSNTVLKEWDFSHQGSFNVINALLIITARLNLDAPFS